MNEITRAKRTMMYRLTDELEFLITDPSGRMRFFGFWSGFWFLVRASREGFVLVETQ